MTITVEEFDEIEQGQEDTVYEQFVLQMASPQTKKSQSDMLVTAALGLAGETGEVVDLVKKVLYHNKPLEEVQQKLFLEIGDVEWYLALLRVTLGFERRDILSANVKKLTERHPSGIFTPDYHS